MKPNTSQTYCYIVNIESFIYHIAIRPFCIGFYTPPHLHLHPNLPLLLLLYYTIILFIYLFILFIRGGYRARLKWQLANAPI